MNKAVEARKIQMDFDIPTGRLNLSTRTGLERGDLLEDTERLKELVVSTASLMNTDSLPAHVLTLQTGSEGRINVRTYIHSRENGQEYLLLSSQISVTTSNPCHAVYARCLKEAGQ